VKLPQWPLQVAIYDRLHADLAMPVYDEIPPDAKPPYIVIGEDTGSMYGNKIRAGQEVTETVHIWSDSPGMDKVKIIMSQVVESLTKEPLAVEGFAATRAQVDMNDTLRDPSGLRHGVLRFRFKILEV
jgi:hypothetical protein